MPKLASLRYAFRAFTSPFEDLFQPKEMTIASVSTGARWGTVYADLLGHDVSVMGGREGVVGVGGLVLGGGVSWYTPKRAFACDKIHWAFTARLTCIISDRWRRSTMPMASSRRGSLAASRLIELRRARSVAMNRPESKIHRRCKWPMGKPASASI